MRWAIGLLVSFALAVATALFAAGNGATLSIFWPPQRIDLSLNLVLLLLGALFVLAYLAVRALSSLLALPARAQAWRMAHHERVLFEALIDTLDHLAAGRYTRARKSADQILAREAALARGGESLPGAQRLRATAYALGAEAAHALQDASAREGYLERALDEASQGEAAGLRDGLVLRAVRWAVQTRRTDQAAHWLAQLPSGVARRTAALRLRLKWAQQAQRSDAALETARLLAKHRAFSALQALSLVRALACQAVADSASLDALQTLWARLDASERALPEVACSAAGRWLRLGGDAAPALHWLQPVWAAWPESPEPWSDERSALLVRVLENALQSAPPALAREWLVRIELAQRQRPGEALLTYLEGQVCLRLELWGKARQLLQQATARLGHQGALCVKAWQALGELATREGRQQDAVHAWQQALTLSTRRTSGAELL